MAIVLAHLAKGKKALQHWLVSGRGQALRTRSPEGGLGTFRSSGFRPLRRSPQPSLRLIAPDHRKRMGETRLIVGRLDGEAGPPENAQRCVERM